MVGEHREGAGSLILMGTAFQKGGVDMHGPAFDLALNRIKTWGGGFLGRQRGGSEEGRKAAKGEQGEEGAKVGREAFHGGGGMGLDFEGSVVGFQVWKPNSPIGWSPL